jgi:CHASE3 domain sensor protein
VTPNKNVTRAMLPVPYAPVASRFFLLGLLILTAVGVIANRAIERLRADGASVGHSHDVLTTLTGIESEMAKASSARRGFLIARDSSFVNQYSAARNHADDLFDDLDSLTQDSPEQRNRAATLRRAAAERFTLMRTSMESPRGIDRGGKELLPTDASALKLRSALYGLMA